MSQRQRERAAQHRRRRWRLAWVGGVLLVVALGGVLFLPISEDGSSDPVAISMVEYAFDPADATAEPGQELRIANDGAITHNYLITDLGKGVELEPGEEGVLELPGDVEPGTYRVICDLSGHVEAGMTGTLEVT